MTTKRKTATVSKKLTPEDRLNASRWSAFVRTSGLPFEELSESWLDFYDCAGDCKASSIELERLIDVAIKTDEENLK
jgi:hypothetical protein